MKTRWSKEQAQGELNKFVEAYRSGDTQKAANIFGHAFEGYLFFSMENFARRTCGIPPERADDLVRSVALAIIEQIANRKIKHPAQIKSYLFSSTRNRAINYHRSKDSGTMRLEGEHLASVPSVSKRADLELSSRSIAFKYFFDDIPTAYKHMRKLQDIEVERWEAKRYPEFSYSDPHSYLEMGRRLGVSDDTIKRRIIRYQKWFKDQIK